jgi:hypothetical protein
MLMTEPTRRDALLMTAGAAALVSGGIQATPAAVRLRAEEKWSYPRNNFWLFRQCIPTRDIVILIHPGAQVMGPSSLGA